jgi:hypothetical protein
VPQWAPPNENHLLRSRSAIRSIKYDLEKIVYKTYDAESKELFKLANQPREIIAGNDKLKPAENIDQSNNSYSVQKVDCGGFVVRIHHNQPVEVSIYLQ